ncbi:MAG: TetR/AcrR family transcriptional regulator [Candidatus Omnitrophica bacterium]|nr:TetR/AcrR family transcriptional regulator [Candidatus Omnitrophota bacterium]
MAREPIVTKRQQEIVEAVKKIIAADGFDRLTVREIAGRLKITEGALYRHFKSKNDIVSLLIDDVERTLLEVVDAATEKAEDPLGKLRCVLSANIQYAEKRKGLTFIVINETLSMRDPVLRKKMESVVNVYLKKIENILDKGIKEKVFRQDLNVRLTSLAFFGLVQSLVTVWGLSGHGFALDRQKISGLFDLYKEGIMRK